MATIKIYQPQLSVKLFKTIQRTKIDGTTPVSQRFQATDTSIDLGPYLGEGGGVHVTKSVREPAGGFSITLADRAYMAAGGFDSLYGVIEPMDFVEIRMRHDPSVSFGAPPPVVMRGFISEVQRSESIGGDGKPSRTVTLTGQDYGKLWQMLQVLFLPSYIVGEDTLTNFKLFERFGVGMQTDQSVSDFVKQVVTEIINPYLANLMPANTTNPTSILTDTVVVKHGKTSVTGPQSQEGTVYNILKTFCDVGPWNELYLEDREDGVHCVFRPNPYKSLDGNGSKIQSDAPDVLVTPVFGKDIIAMNVSRSDADVANYYWVNGARFEMSTNVYRKQYAVKDTSTVLLKESEYPNSSVRLYGIRVMNVDTQLGGDENVTSNSGQDKSTQDTRDTNIANWIDNRRKILVKQNADNVVFERGTFRMRGNEAIRAGTYISMTRGQFNAEYYVTNVAHDFIPYQGFFTTVTVERGTGFVERAKRESGQQSPYLAEMMGSL